MLPESVRKAIFWAADAVFGPWTIALLFGTGLFLTIRLRFVQVARFGEAVRALVPRRAGARAARSPFQAFMTALGASIGTGNIAGVATAVVSGGPGARLLDLGLRLLRHRHQVHARPCSASSSAGRRGDRAVRRAHALPARRAAARRGWPGPTRWSPGVAALTTTPFTQPNSIAVVLAEPVRHPHLGLRAS